MDTYMIFKTFCCEVGILLLLANRENTCTVALKWMYESGPLYIWVEMQSSVLLLCWFPEFRLRPDFQLFLLFCWFPDFSCFPDLLFCWFPDFQSSFTVLLFYWFPNFQVTLFVYCFWVPTWSTTPEGVFQHAFLQTLDVVSQYIFCTESSISNSLLSQWWKTYLLI